MRYGLGYQGSKNKIAEWVVEQLPAAETLVDLFAGGCSITHCAMLKNKYKKYIANDKAPIIDLFKKAINGEYSNETRWIDRETFFAEEEKDPYIKYCWSFGNSGKSYLYSKEIEPWKKDLHYPTRERIVGVTEALTMNNFITGRRLKIIYLFPSIRCQSHSSK